MSFSMVDNIQHPHLLPDKVPRLHPTSPAGRSAPPSPRWGFAGCQPASTHLSPHCWCQSQNSEMYKLTVNMLEQISPHDFFFNYAGHLCLHPDAFCLLLSWPSITFCSKWNVSVSCFIISCVQKKKSFCLLVSSLNIIHYKELHWQITSLASKLEI